MIFCPAHARARSGVAPVTLVDLVPFVLVRRAPDLAGSLFLAPFFWKLRESAE